MAREAMACIHRWQEEKSSGRRKISAPRLAIKFCGGCNPSFERAAVAEILRRDLRNVSWVSPEEETDLLVIINGCLRSCAERPEVEQKALENLVIRNHSVSAIKKKSI